MSTIDLNLPMDEVAAEPEPELLFSPDPVVPLLPTLLMKAGQPRPQVLDFRRDTKIGPVMAQVDASDPEAPQLPPGVYWICARWPTGHGQARQYADGAFRKWVVETEEQKLTKLRAASLTAARLAEPTPPAQPAPPAQPSIPVELSRALQDLAASQATIAARLERLEHTPAPAPAPAPQAPIGGSALMDRVMMALVERALAPLPPPPPPPDPLGSMKAFLELQKSWQDVTGKGSGDGNTTAQVVGGIIDAARDAIDAIPDAAEKIARARMMQGLQLLDPVDLLRQIPATPDQTLAAWLARALQCGLIDLDVLGGGGIGHGAEAAEMLAEVLRWGPVGKSRLRTIVVGALRLLEGEAEGKAGELQTSGPGVNGAGSTAGQLPSGGAGANAGNGSPGNPT